MRAFRIGRIWYVRIQVRSTLYRREARDIRRHR